MTVLDLFLFLTVANFAKLITFYPYLTNYDPGQMGILWMINWFSVVTGSWQGNLSFFVSIPSLQHVVKNLNACTYNEHTLNKGII